MQTTTDAAIRHEVFNLLIDREIQRDRDQQRRSNPWTDFLNRFFAECRETGRKPWANTGLHPMTYASQLYQCQQEMQEALVDNGQWDAETEWRWMDVDEFPDPASLDTDLEEEGL